MMFLLVVSRMSKCLIHSLNGCFFCVVNPARVVNDNLRKGLNFLKYIDISRWIIFDQFNPNIGKIWFWRALQQVIHRVIHNFCG